MTYVVGREGGEGPVADLGVYRTLDGSAGAALAVDVDRPHSIAVVGKRGYGKSYTLGVLAEELAGVAGVAPVVLDPLGVFRPLGDLTGPNRTAVPATVVERPAVAPGALDPRSWCRLVGLSPESGPGALVWSAARSTGGSGPDVSADSGPGGTDDSDPPITDGIEAMCEHVRSVDAPTGDTRAAVNHLRMAESWGVFDPDGLGAPDLAGSAVTVLDLSGLDGGPASAVARVVAETLYRARIDDRVDRLPWLLVDEAQTFVDGVAAGAFRTLWTRGRAPGVSTVVATQRPSALPAVCVSQSDLLVAHRLTAESDLAALESARPTYVDGTYADRLPTEPGDVLVVDDRTESVHAARVRERTTPHGGTSPRASEFGESRDSHATTGAHGGRSGESRASSPEREREARRRRGSRLSEAGR